MKTIRSLSFAFAALVLSAAAVAATNEIVQCWAVTKSGSRCKRRAAPETRYCRQHAATRELKDTPPQCGSMTTNGDPCRLPPLPNRRYCAEHM